MQDEKRKEGRKLQYKKSRERGRDRIVKEGRKEVHCTAQERKEGSNKEKMEGRKGERKKRQTDRQIARNRDLHHHYCA